MATDTRLDTRQHVRALRDALKVTLGATNVYEWGQVPGESGNAGSLPPMWALVSLQRVQNTDLRVSAEAGMTEWRVTVGVVGSTPDETRWLLYKTAIALNEESLSIGGATTSPLQHESERAATRDEGRYYSAVIYTYAL